MCSTRLLLKIQNLFFKVAEKKSNPPNSKLHCMSVFDIRFSFSFLLLMYFTTRLIALHDLAPDESKIAKKKNLLYKLAIVACMHM